MSAVHAVTTFAVADVSDMAAARTELEETLRDAGSGFPEMISRVTVDSNWLRVAVTLPDWDIQNGEHQVVMLMDEVSTVSGDRVTQLHTEFRSHSLIPTSLPDIVDDGPYEIATEYAAGNISRDNLVQRLGSYSYAKRGTDDEVDVPGSVDELTRAHDDGLLGDRDYMDILRAVSTQAIEDAPDDVVDMMALAQEMGQSMLRHGVGFALVVLPCVNENDEQEYSFMMIGQDADDIQTDTAELLRDAAEFADNHDSESDEG